MVYNEGSPGPGMLGPLAYTKAIEAGLRDVPGVTVEQVTGDRVLRFERPAQDPWPVLQRFDLDLQTWRWHALESTRARRALTATLDAGRRPDALLVYTQSCALQLEQVMRRVPTFLNVDATFRQWREMAVWRRMRPYSELVMRPSLRAEVRAYTACTRVLAWSEWARQGVLRAAPDADVVAHHPGVDCALYRPAERRPRQRPRILFVGARFAQKGGHQLLRVLAPRLGRDIDLDLVTTADVPERDGVRVHRLGGGDPRLVDLYQQADLLCLPTRGDSNPWVLLEAMACGTPVVSSSIGAIPELLDHGRSGLVLADARDETLGAAIELGLGGAGIPAMVEAARARVAERYDAARQGPALLDILSTRTPA